MRICFECDRRFDEEEWEDRHNNIEKPTESVHADCCPCGSSVETLSDWPPSEKELLIVGSQINRFCAEGCGDLKRSDPLCRHESMAIDSRSTEDCRADYGDEQFGKDYP